MGKSAVWPDNVGPAAAAAGAAAARPRADPTSAAAEFAALGLGGVGFGAKPKGPGFAPQGRQQPPFGGTPMGGPPMGGYGPPQSAAAPNYMNAMRAMPAAGARSNVAAQPAFRLG